VPAPSDPTWLPPAAIFTARGVTSPEGPCAVAVGNFDGVHQGHAALVGRLRETARQLGVPAVAVTFDPHPAQVVRPGAAPVPLTTIRRRADLLLALGLDAVVVQESEPRLLALDAESFYRRLLRGRWQAAGLVEGPDFRFGAGRTGDVSMLRRWCGEDGVRFEVVEPVSVGGEPVSSSRIRDLVAAGDVASAAALLTAAYRLTGTVVSGARRGTGLGFPTANLAGITTILPADGVYAARASVQRDASDDQPCHAAAVHVGPPVTFGGPRAVEVHLIGFDGDLYGATLDVDFLQRLRETRRFASPEELRDQLARDVRAAAMLSAAGPSAAVEIPSERS